MKTFRQKPAEVTKKWVLIDAKGLVSAGSPHCRDAPSRQTPPDLYAPCRFGDHVIIINAAHVVLTGRKRDNKFTTITPASSAASRNVPRSRSSRAAFPSAWSRRLSSA